MKTGKIIRVLSFIGLLLMSVGAVPSSAAADSGSKVSHFYCNTTIVSSSGNTAGNTAFVLKQTAGHAPAGEPRNV